MPYVVSAVALAHPIAVVPERSAVSFIGPGRSSDFFTYRSGELEKGPVAALTVAFGDLAAGVPDALRSLEQDPAWCVTLFAGHGASLALAGGDQLGAALRKHGDDTPAGVAEWGAGLRPEVAKRQAMAACGTYYYAPPSCLHVG
ncbi:hypothetical protein [Lentzea flava]|uniref:Uncharacterized protein n=1 Tax=Lentzea flava TaxID=103732 RepID=A0ABQ2VJ85_9PSEU|nr:hypothetical protein [Lentzea flava]MCP2205363.1 hypothetical protein [Lentzea flava]GGU85980.1 hypothetical protein GCM10010178_90100 [Lentzea flava]